MKRLGALLLCLFLLSGCGGTPKEVERGMTLRRKLLAAKTCSFDATVTADYGEEVQIFALSCVANDQGDLDFTVTAPETIAGITGKISQEGGKLTFADQVLTFSMLADGQITPVITPWIFLRTLRGGYLSSACQEGELLRLTLDDSYEGEDLQLDIWLDAQDNPVRGDILYRQRRILALTVTNFEIG